MKYYWKVLMSMAFVLGIVVMGFSPAAQAVPILELSDGVTTVTIVDGGVGDLKPEPGMVKFSGAVGVFIINLSTGITKPEIGSAAMPELDLLSVDISAGAGTLALKFTETDFTVPGPPGYTASIGGTTDGTMASYTVYRDQTNAPFGTSETLSTIGPLPGPGAFSGQTDTISTLAAAPYSLTLAVTVTHPGVKVAEVSSFNANLMPNPEPGTMLLFGTGLLGVLGYGWRRRKQAA